SHAALGLSGGKDQHRLRAGQVTSATNDLLALHGHGAAEQFDLGADALGVGCRPFKTHRYSRGARIVAIDTKSAIEVIHYKIHVPVIIQVANRQALADPRLVGPPLMSHLLELQVPQVPECD